MEASLAYHFHLLCCGGALNHLRRPELADDVRVARHYDDIGDDLQEDRLGPGEDSMAIGRPYLREVGCVNLACGSDLAQPENLNLVQLL